MIVSRYAERYREFGYHYKSVGWGNWETQKLRFLILSEIADLEGAEVVDLGCGFGDLYGFLSEKYKNVKYTGIDLAKDLVEEGQRRYPKAQFLVQDILEENFRKEADFYFISGTLNSRITGDVSYTKEILTKAFELTKKGLAVNFLTKYVDYELEKDLHHSPEEIFTFVKGFTKHVTLRHDYPLW
jgi:SAM-dependent methyltransferase